MKMEKIPIYTATKSLDVRYKFSYESKENASVIVPGDINHALLYTAADSLLSTRRAMQFKTGGFIYEEKPIKK